MKTGKKILFIGDVHGLNEWEQLVKDALKQFYEIVFLGDYVDSFFLKASDQLYNLNNICKFAQKNKDRVTLLLGNHDYAYIYGIDSISGKQYMQAHEYVKIFNDNLNLFQMAWGYTNPVTQKYTLATHAGLAKNFYTFLLKPEIQEGEKIHETLNRLQEVKKIVWKVGSARGGVGTPGPLWADYTEIMDDPYEGINQVFGHTPRVAVTIDHNGDDFIACIDTWGNKKIANLIITL